jgi:hypothetical protein
MRGGREQQRDDAGRGVDKPPLRWSGGDCSACGARGRDIRERFEIETEIAGGLKSLLAIFFEAMIDDAREGRRNICVRGAKLGRLVFQNRGHGLDAGVAAKGALP